MNRSVFLVRFNKLEVRKLKDPPGFELYLDCITNINLKQVRKWRLVDGHLIFTSFQINFHKKAWTAHVPASFLWSEGRALGGRLFGCCGPSCSPDGGEEEEEILVAKSSPDCFQHPDPQIHSLNTEKEEKQDDLRQWKRIPTALQNHWICAKGMSFVKNWKFYRK